MQFDSQQAKLWLKEYDVEDLARSLLRQFLFQNQLTNTLAAFQAEDKRKYKKISKATLVRLLSLNNLVFSNKNSDQPYKSLLEILASYLRDKFRNKLNGIADQSFKKTATSNFNVQENKSERNKMKTSLNDTGGLKEPRQSNTNERNNNYKNKLERNVRKQRPKTSKPENHKKVQQIYAVLEQQVKQNQKLKFKRDQQLKKKEQLKRKNQEKLKKSQELKKLQQQLLKQKQQEVKRQKLRLQKDKLENQRKQEQIKRKQQEKKKQQQKIKKMQEEQLKKRQQEKKKQEQIKRKVQQQQLKKRQQKKREEQRKKIIQQQQKKQRKEQIQLAKIQQQRKQKQRKNTEELLKIQKQQKNKLNSEQNIKQSNQINLQQNVQKINRTGGMRKILKKTQSNQLPLSSNLNQEQSKSSKEEIVQFILPIAQKVQEPKQIEQKKSQQPPSKMMKMFGKKKKNNQNVQAEQIVKFKFDENFVDVPLRPQMQNYEYQKMQLGKIVIASQQKAQINYRQKMSIGSKKYQQKAISEQQSQQLRKAVFQSGPSTLPKSWHQGFLLSPHPNTTYGLQQIQGGPCGIIAAAQCFFLKHFLYLAHPTLQQMSNETIRQNCLVAAIADMLFKVKTGSKIILALPPKSFSGTKVDLSNLRLLSIDANTFTQLFEGVWQNKTYFIGKSNHGVAILMYSIIMTKTIEKIWQEMDINTNPLIGQHGHCTQQLVNLFITGVASSNCFDGHKLLDTLKLKGIEQKSQFGFLTIFETLRYIEVGKNLKNPIYPFWIICKQFHYHVIFANHYLIAENNHTTKFDIVYFDGLYNCADKIIITLQSYPYGAQPEIKIKDLPLIEQVMMTKWGIRKADWNGSIKIL